MLYILSDIRQIVNNLFVFIYHFFFKIVDCSYSGYVGNTAPQYSQVDDRYCISNFHIDLRICFSPLFIILSYCQPIVNENYYHLGML